MKNKFVCEDCGAILSDYTYPNICMHLSIGKILVNAILELFT